MVNTREPAIVITQKIRRHSQYGYEKTSEQKERQQDKKQGQQVHKAIMKWQY